MLTTPPGCCEMCCSTTISKAAEVDSKRQRSVVASAETNEAQLDSNADDDRCVSPSPRHGLRSSSSWGGRFERDLKEVVEIKTRSSTFKTRFPAVLVLYLHGGAFALCGTETHRDLIMRMVTDTQVTVFAVDYSRPPENPYPGPLEDCLATYTWLLEQGFSPSSIIFAGDSAGGGLAPALVDSARSAGLPLPAGVFCISPWVDYSPSTFSSASWRANYPAYDFLPPDTARFFAECYAGSHSLEEVSPINIDFKGFPPMLIVWGELECLDNQIEAFVKKVQSNGVDVCFHRAKDMVHVYPLFGSLASADAEPNTCFKGHLLPFLHKLFPGDDPEQRHDEGHREAMHYVEVEFERAASRDTEATYSGSFNNARDVGDVTRVPQI